MATSDLAPATPPRGSIRTAAVVASVTSAMAGLVHLGAARSHEGDPTLVQLFVACAIAQLAVAIALLLAPRRSILVTALTVNAGAVVAWGLSRTVGVAAIDSLASPEAVGSQDLTAAVFAAASVAATLVVLLRPEPRRVLTPTWVATLAVFGLLAAVPAATASHSHHHAGDAHIETGGHAHGGHASDAEGEASHEGSHTEDAAHEHDDGAATLVDHDHSASADGEHGHDGGQAAHDPAAPHHSGASHGPAAHGPAAHAPDAPHDPGAPHDPSAPHGPGDPHDPGDPHEPAPTGPIISVDDPRLTPAQRATALRLISEMKAAMLAFPTVEAVEAAGYRSIGDGGSVGYEHYVNWSYLSDPYELNASRVESIVMKKNGDGTKTLVSGMYILSLGKTMADVPELAGDLTTWHDHRNLCFEGTRLVGTTVGGRCERGTLLVTPPMLHVWVVDHPCGPFAGIDEHGVGCATHEH